MKIPIILSVAALIVAMESPALAMNYDDLVAQGYRWATTDGPYACPTKEDLRQITSNPTDSSKLHMVEQLRAYYLIQEP
jgi:hypothetical protein